MVDLHPSALAYLRACAAANGAADVPMGVTSPAMAMHRAQTAWLAAGCQIEETRPSAIRVIVTPALLRQIEDLGCPRGVDPVAYAVARAEMLRDALAESQRAFALALGIVTAERDAALASAGGVPRG